MLEIVGVFHVRLPSLVYNTVVPLESYHRTTKPEGTEVIAKATDPDPHRLPLVTVGEPVTQGGGSSLIDLLLLAYA